MNRRAPLPLGILCCLTAMLCACASAPPPREGYFGPTLSVQDVIARLNENNSKLPTLWARQDFEATIVDPQQNKSHFVNGYGTLLYTSPNEMRLVGRKEVTDLFDMGSDGAQFWLRLVPDQDTFWWGNLADVDKTGSQAPIRPDLILEVLGIRPINPSLLQEPVPVMRFSNAVDCYMIVWQARQGDHWAPTKEIWYDRATLHPKRIVLFDPNGRVVLNAVLTQFEAVEVAELSQDQWPHLATHYQLSFPASGSTMTLDLSDVSVTHNGFPKAASYRMPDPAALAASGVKVIHLNEEGAP
jgi:hypothetical protein